MKKLFSILFYLIFCSTSLSDEIIGKSIKCETERETIRGYPFYFFFENSTNVKSYFIKDEKVKFFNKKYVEIKSNVFDIQHTGEIDKKKLIFTLFKGRREYDCIFLSSKEIINEELKEFIKLGLSK